MSRNGLSTGMLRSREEAGWPRIFPIGVAAAALLAVLCGQEIARPHEPIGPERQRVAVADPAVKPCQALGYPPANPVGGRRPSGDWSVSGGWESNRAMAWNAYAQGEYVGRDRAPHVGDYRLRVDDQLDLVYRLTREERPEPYRINVGDEIRVESMTDETLDRNLIVQPDGTITLRMLGQIKATGLTVPQLQQRVEEDYKRLYRTPAITVTPIKVDTKLEDLRAAVDRRQGLGGQSQVVKVTPEGTISLPAIGSVYVQGLTLGEAQTELCERYRAVVPGVEVIPALVVRAPRYVYVLGEVGQPGRFEMTGPTTLLQALALAGSWNNGAQIDQVVVFRRGDDWRLTATMVNLRPALRGKSSCPAGEIWLSDSDVVIVPKGPILETTDFIELVFTRGIYGVLPFSASLSFYNGLTGL